VIELQVAGLHHAPPARPQEAPMSDVRPQDVGETANVEVRAYRGGELVNRQLCESAEQAAALVAVWEEAEGVECEVDDLSTHHRPGDLLEPELAEPLADDDRRED
jgi:hypothetical protein